MIDRMFHEIEDAHVILASRGVYKQAKLYRRYDGTEQGIYAAAAGGYIRLCGNGGTTHPKWSWLDMHAPGGEIIKGTLGRPALAT